MFLEDFFLPGRRNRHFFVRSSGHQAAARRQFFLRLIAGLEKPSCGRILGRRRPRRYPPSNPPSAASAMVFSAPCHLSPISRSRRIWPSGLRLEQPFVNRLFVCFGVRRLPGNAIENAREGGSRSYWVLTDCTRPVFPASSFRRTTAAAHSWPGPGAEAWCASCSTNRSAQLGRWFAQ